MTPRKKETGTIKKMPEEATQPTVAEAVDGEVLSGVKVHVEEGAASPGEGEWTDGEEDGQRQAESQSELGDLEATEAIETEKVIEELREQYLRACAETDNIRKRASVEVANARKFALEGFARELLNVKDSLELARAVDLESAGGDSEISAKVVEGIDLTIKQLETVFGQYSIDEVNPEPGEKLDPERHQAMSMEETAEFEPSRICRVIQRGYLLHDRLLRPAMVIVAKAPVDA